MGGQIITNAGQAVAATSVPTLAQTNALIASAIAGQTAIKNPVRAIATSNITLSGTQTVDGVSLNVGDRVAAIGQTTGTQNNIYVVAASTWAIASDSNSNSDWIEGTEFLVAEGTTYGGSIFRQTTSGAITLGTTALAFVQTTKINTYTADQSTLNLTGSVFSARLGSGLTTAAGGITIDTTVVARKYSANITGDGATTSFTVTHSLRTVDDICQLRDSANNVDYADIQNISTTQTTVAFGTAPPNGTVYRLTCIG